MRASSAFAEINHGKKVKVRIEHLKNKRNFHFSPRWHHWQNLQRERQRKLRLYTLLLYAAIIFALIRKQYFE